MLSNTSLLVSLGLASLAQAGPRRFRRDEDSDSGVDPWTQFEDQECQRSDFTADYSREDVDELLQSLKDEAEEKVTIPAGEEGSNNRFFYCKAAGLIIGNHGDNDKRLSLSSFSDKLSEAVDELDCDKTESMFLKLFSDDDDDTELHVWIQGPNESEGKYWDESFASGSTDDSDRIRQMCDYPEEE